jgi:hypothetical protein
MIQGALATSPEFWESPDFSRVSMPPGFPDALRRTANLKVLRDSRSADGLGSSYRSAIYYVDDPWREPSSRAYSSWRFTQSIKLR